MNPIVQGDDAKVDQNPQTTISQIPPDDDEGSKPVGNNEGILNISRRNFLFGVTSGMVVSAGALAGSVTGLRRFANNNTSVVAKPEVPSVYPSPENILKNLGIPELIPVGMRMLELGDLYCIQPNTYSQGVKFLEELAKLLQGDDSNIGFFDGWGTQSEELFNTQQIVPQIPLVVTPNPLIIGDGLAEIEALHRKILSEIAVICPHLVRAIPQIVIGTEEADPNNNIYYAYATQKKVVLPYEQGKDRAWVTDLHELQHMFDFRPDLVRPYVELDRIARYYAKILQSLIDVADTVASFNNPDSILRQKIEGGEYVPLFGNGTFFGLDPSRIQQIMNKIVGTYSPYMQTSPQSFSIGDLTHRFNMVFSNLSRLFKSKSLGKLRAEIPNPHLIPEVDEFMGIASRELFHYWVGPVQAIGGGPPVVEKPEIFYTRDLLTQHNIVIEGARLGIAYPDHTAFWQSRLWNPHI